MNQVVRRVLPFVGVTFFASSIWIATRKEEQLEDYFDYVTTWLWDQDPNPTGSLSASVLERMYSGLVPKDEFANFIHLEDEEKRKKVDDIIKQDIVELLTHLKECEEEKENNIHSSGQCLIEKHGYHTVIAPSTLGPYSGDGSFIRTSKDSSVKGNVPAWKVISIYEGDLVSPWKQWVTMVAGKTHTDNEWLLSRGVDGYVVDGKPYGSASPNYIGMKDQLCNHSVHIGQLVNHPPKDLQPNVAYYHVIFSKGDKYYPAIASKIDPIRCDKSPYGQKTIRISVLISLSEIEEGEELFANYAYCPIYHWPTNEFEQPKLMLPPWYHPVVKE